MSDVRAPLEARLEAACERALGRGRIEGLRRLSGGASQETWSFDWAPSGAASRRLILRRNGRQQFQNLRSSTEYALVNAAGRIGVPVPGTAFLLREEDDLGQGYVMERVEGETIPRKILRDDDYASALPQMTAQAGAILARIHTLDFEAIEGLGAPRPDDDSTCREIAKHRELIDRFAEPHPTFELALRWLEDEKPEPLPVALVHGDFRLGNFMIGPDGIRSVLDWELAHVGDPIEDLGWLCVKAWRFGVTHKTVGGFGEIDELCASYGAAGGKGATPERVRYWMVFGTLRWGVICQAQAFAHRSGMIRSVELAAIGRRVCETEWDLLELIG